MPHHVMEITTREGYEYSIRKHLLPWFGPMRMIDILPGHVRQWITHLQTGNQVGPKTITNVKNMLSAILTTDVARTRQLGRTRPTHACPVPSPRPPAGPRRP